MRVPRNTGAYVFAQYLGFLNTVLIPQIDDDAQAAPRQQHGAGERGRAFGAEQPHRQQHHQHRAEQCPFGAGGIVPEGQHQPAGEQREQPQPLAAVQRGQAGADAGQYEGLQQRKGPYPAVLHIAESVEHLARPWGEHHGDAAQPRGLEQPVALFGKQHQHAQKGHRRDADVGGILVHLGGVGQVGDEPPCLLKGVGADLPFQREPGAAQHLHDGGQHRHRRDGDAHQREHQKFCHQRR